MGISFVTTSVARRSQFHQDIVSSHLSAASLTTQQVLGHISQLMQQRGFDSVTAGQKAHVLLYQNASTASSVIELCRCVPRHGDFISGNHSFDSLHASGGRQTARNLISIS
jgi:hypothetical protein